MSLHLYSPTEKVIVLVGFFNSHNVLAFPSQNVKFPGLHFQSKALTSIHDQILAYVEKHCMISDLRKDFELDASFSEAVKMGEEDATLYLATVKNFEDKLPRYLQTLPILIRGMSKDRSRLPYLKALQALSGSREHSIRAVEVRE